MENNYFKDKADAILGEKTKKALRKFQNENGLTGDGLIGPKTLNKIKELKESKMIQPPKSK